MAGVTKVSGVVSVESTTYAGKIAKAFTYYVESLTFDGASLTESAPLGSAVTNESGEYEIFLTGGYESPVFVAVFDDYGDPFVANEAVEIGDRLHPSTPTGLVYECTSSGTLPASEPSSWPTDKGATHSIGTASFEVLDFYRPLLHGPLTPEVISTDVGDPHFDNVSLLLNFEGNNLSTDFINQIDGQPIIRERGNGLYDHHNSYPIEFAGGYITTSIKRMGSASLSLLGSGGRMYPRADFVATGLDSVNAWTIEGWFYRTHRTGDFDTLFGFHYSNGSNRLVFSTSSTFGSGLVETAYQEMPIGRWVHVAAVLDSGYIKLFFGGIKVADIDASSNSIVSGDTFTIGQDFDIGMVVSDHFNGFVDEFRVTAGVARYTNAFTPPDAPFPDSGIV